MRSHTKTLVLFVACGAVVGLVLNLLLCFVARSDAVSGGIIGFLRHANYPVEVLLEMDRGRTGGYPGLLWQNPIPTVSLYVIHWMTEGMVVASIIWYFTRQRREARGFPIDPTDGLGGRNQPTLPNGHRAEDGLGR